MSSLDRFFSTSRPSLKICGVRLASDARRLVELGVPALGVNFWPGSKRYLAPESATWLDEMRNRIVRVGVFVNADPAHALDLVRRGLIDVVQLHGDEDPEGARPYRDANVPFIKAIGVSKAEHLAQATAYGATAILLDAHAPGLYGGTGATIDWVMADGFRRDHIDLPMVLAGGIVPENAAAALAATRPAALDVASGAEISPGVKDFVKVAALLQATADIV